MCLDIPSHGKCACPSIYAASSQEGLTPHRVWTMVGCTVLHASPGFSLAYSCSWLRMLTNHSLCSWWRPSFTPISW